jgi:hypothetical protein
MWQVNNERRGTAYGSRVMDEAYLVAGKTGTSQVRNITAAEREAGVIANEDLPWERRDHALYVGYAPFEAPRYAVSVVVEHGGGGAAVAAPIARDILLQGTGRRHPAARALPGVPAPRHRGDAPPPADPRGTPDAIGPRLGCRPGQGGTGHELSRIQRRVHAHGLAQDPAPELGAGPSCSWPWRASAS